MTPLTARQECRRLAEEHVAKAKAIIADYEAKYVWCDDDKAREALITEFNKVCLALVDEYNDKFEKLKGLFP